MSRSFAKDVAVRGQRVATFIRASPIASAAVAKAAKAQNIKGSVLSGNATRFTSVIRMLESLQQLRPALTAAMDEQPSPFKPAVNIILSDRYTSAIKYLPRFLLALALHMERRVLLALLLTCDPSLSIMCCIC